MRNAENLTNRTIVNSEIPPDHPSKREIEQGLGGVYRKGLGRGSGGPLPAVGHRKLAFAGRSLPTRR